MDSVGLRLHPDKTKIVYCKDRKRRFDCECTSFTFLGFTFRARKAPAGDGTSMFAAFLPAISKDALKVKSRTVRGWRLPLRTTNDLAELAAWMNPVIRGWMQYYGKFYRTEMDGLLRRINAYLMPYAVGSQKVHTAQGVHEVQGLVARAPAQGARSLRPLGVDVRILTD